MADLKADVAVGYAFEDLERQPIQGFRSLGGQAPAGRLVDIAQGSDAAYHRAVVAYQDIFFRGAFRQAVGEIADDLLKDIFEGDEPLHHAVLVHHDADMALVLAEVGQLLRYRRVLGHKVGILGKALDGFPGERLRAAFQQASYLAHVKNADHVVDIAFEYRQPGELRFAELVDQLLGVVGEIESLDFIARHHDVVDGDLIQIEDIDQDALPLLVNAAAGFVHYGTQLLAAQAVIALPG